MSSEDAPILDPPWKELVKVASEWDYGSMHTHGEISGIIRLPYGDIHYYSEVNRAAKELLVLGKRIQCVYNKGYKVLKPSEYPKTIFEDTKSVFLKMKDVHADSLSAPVKEMDDLAKQRTENLQSHTGQAVVTLATVVNTAHAIAGIERKQHMIAKAAKGKD